MLEARLEYGMPQPDHFFDHYRLEWSKTGNAQTDNADVLPPRYVPPMPPIPRDIEDELRDFLKQTKSERGNLSDILRGFKGSLDNIFNRLGDHEKKDDDRHTEIKDAIAGVNARVNALEVTSAVHTKTIEHLEKQDDRSEREIDDIKTGRIMTPIQPMFPVALPPRTVEEKRHSLIPGWVKKETLKLIGQLAAAAISGGAAWHVISRLFHP